MIEFVSVIFLERILEIGSAVKTSKNKQEKNEINFLVSTRNAFNGKGRKAFADVLIKSKMALKGHEAHCRTNLSWEA